MPLQELDLKLTNKQREKLKKISAVCNKQESINPKMTRILVQGVVDEKFKCFIQCMMEKAGFVEDRKVRNSKIKHILGPIYGFDKIKIAKLKCKEHAQFIDSCEEAYQMFECYYVNAFDTLEETAN